MRPRSLHDGHARPTAISLRRPMILVSCTCILLVGCADRPFFYGKITTPQIVSFGAGGACNTSRPYCIASIEPGIAGVKSSIGVSLVDDGDLSYHFIHSIDLAVLYTWGEPAGIEPDQTCIGIEGNYRAPLLHVNCGVFRHVAGTSDQWPWLWSVGIGTGF